MFKGFLSYFGTFLNYIIVVCILFLVCQQILARPSLHALKYYIKYGLYHALVALVPGFAMLPALFRPGSSENVHFVKFIVNLLHFPEWFGVKVTADGTENFELVEKPCVIICNHQTSLDVLAVQEIPRRTAVLAKKELLKVPVLGFMAWLCGTIFIDRKSHKETVDIMKETAAKIKKYKTSVWIFPEGTRRQIDGMLPFKKGAFHLAVQAQVPILPVVVGNCRNFIDVHHKIFNSGTMRLKVLPPVQTEGLTVDSIPELTNRCRDMMLEAYHQITEEHKEEYVNLKPLPMNKKEM